MNRFLGLECKSYIHEDVSGVVVCVRVPETPAVHPDDRVNCNTLLA